MVTNEIYFHRLQDLSLEAVTMGRSAWSGELEKKKGWPPPRGRFSGPVYLPVNAMDLAQEAETLPFIDEQSRHRAS